MAAETLTSANSRNISEEQTNITLTTFAKFYLASESVGCALIVMGNGTILACFMREARLRLQRNWYICSLSVADLLVGIAAVPFHLYKEATGQPDNFFGCLAVNCLLPLTTVVSVFCMIALTVDRFIAVQCPLKHKTSMSPRIVRLMIGAAWGFGSLVGLLPLLGWKKKERNIKTCTNFAVIPGSYYIFSSIATILLPLIVLFALHAKIHCVLKRRVTFLQPKGVRQNTPSERETAFMTRMRVRMSTKRQQNDVKLFRIVAIVVMTFVVSWLPLFCLNIARSAGVPSSYKAGLVCVFFSHLNSILNPLVYAFGLPEFKTAVIRLFSCGKKGAHSRSRLRFPFSVDRDTSSSTVRHLQVSIVGVAVAATARSRTETQTRTNSSAGTGVHFVTDSPPRMCQQMKANTHTQTVDRQMALSEDGINQISKSIDIVRRNVLTQGKLVPSVEETTQSTRL